jgi:precorrin-6B methylase 2
VRIENRSPTENTLTAQVQAEAAAAEGQLYNLASQLLTIHESLLKDSARNEAFFAALTASINQDSMVLDIGSGTGLWAIAAAQLGAKHVVAIEQQPLLIGLIRSLARDNGVADRVQVVEGWSTQIQMDAKFDVVISETIGHLVFDEQIVQIMIDARERFLKPEGVLIPHSVTLVVAPAYLDRPARLPIGIPAQYAYFDSLLLNVPVGLTDKKHLKIVGPPKELVRVDLRSVTTPPDLNNLEARWDRSDTEEFNCFAVWAVAGLTAEINIATMQTSSWSTTVYRINPFKENQGDLNFTLALTSQTNYWTATLSNGQHKEAQSYSPAFAGSELLAQTRINTEAFNHLRIMGLMEPSARSA